MTSVFLPIVHMVKEDLQRSGVAEENVRTG